MSCAVLMRAMLPFQPLTWVCINSSSQVDSIECVSWLCFSSDVHKQEGGGNHLDRSNANRIHAHAQVEANVPHQCYE